MLEECLYGLRRYQLPINVWISGADLRLFPERPAPFLSASYHLCFFTNVAVSVSVFVVGISNPLGSRGNILTSCRISSGQNESCSTRKSSRYRRLEGRSHKHTCVWERRHRR